MKSHFLFSFLVIVMALVSCAQDNVLRQKNTDNVQSRSATDEDENLEDATEEENEVEIKLSALPQAIVKAIAGTYAGSTLKEADKITQNDGTVTYDIEITFDGEVIEVMYDGEGNFLGEESPND